MFVNNMCFLTAIDKLIRYRSAVRIEKRIMEHYYNAIDAIVRQYNKANFIVEFIACDPEFKPIFEPIEDGMGITMDYCAAKEHVPEAERNNQTIKDRSRVAYYRLPYRNIPKIMIQTMVLESTRKINLFPAKGGVSAYYSPSMIMNHEVLNYKRHFEVPFGSYVQGHIQPQKTNTMVARTKDGIYLRPILTARGGHILLNLTTKREITCTKCDVIPLTETAKLAVEDMAKTDGVKELKFTDKKGRLLSSADQDLSPDWTAGARHSNQYQQLLDNFDPEDEDSDYEPFFEEEYDDDNDKDDEDDDDPDQEEEDIEALLNDDNDQPNQEPNEQDDDQQEPEDARQQAPQVRRSARNRVAAV